MQRKRRETHRHVSIYSSGTGRPSDGVGVSGDREREKEADGKMQQRNIDITCCTVSSSVIYGMDHTI